MKHKPEVNVVTPRQIQLATTYHGMVDMKKEGSIVSVWAIGHGAAPEMSLLMLEVEEVEPFADALFFLLTESHKKGKVEKPNG